MALIHLIMNGSQAIDSKTGQHTGVFSIGDPVHIKLKDTREENEPVFMASVESAKPAGATHYSDSEKPIIETTGLFVYSIQYSGIPEQRLAPRRERIHQSREIL